MRTRIAIASSWESKMPLLNWQGTIGLVLLMLDVLGNLGSHSNLNSKFIEGFYRGERISAQVSMFISVAHFVEDFQSLKEKYLKDGIPKVVYEDISEDMKFADKIEFFHGMF